MRTLVGLACGLLFGLGLTVSGMIDPARVRGFLDLFGAWDPTLAFVMGGALFVALPGYRLVLRRSRPALAPAFDLPSKRDLDARLIGGAALFGVGWGLAGYCPGPAVTALALGAPATWVFVGAMLVGIAGFDRIAQASPARHASAT